MGSHCQSVISSGADGIVVDVQCHSSNNLPTIVIVGHVSRVVYEAKDRLRGAFASSGLSLPRRRITINLAPADVPKAESSLDLAIASSILALDHNASHTDMPAAIGELGLDGSVRPVRGIIGKLLAGRCHGICSFFVPVGNLEQASLVPGITLYPVATLKQLHGHMFGGAPIEPLHTGDGNHRARLNAITDPSTFDEIVGQEHAKRAAVIAAAGGHNVLLTGPPGSGKSMLAKTLPALLPAMNHEEILLTTHLHSLTGDNYGRVVLTRPLRSPHHSVGTGALLGGGRPLRPGELSLSHHGVLLLDELPEFGRASIEALRGPLENQSVHVTRTGGSAHFTANFMLVATANPCPCGYGSFDNNRCTCSDLSKKRYASKLSGPILDRIDLCSDVHAVDHAHLLGKLRPACTGKSAQTAIILARRAMAERQGGVLNSELGNRELRKYAALSRPSLVVMQNAAHRLQLSARGYMRTLKVARTIADLDGATAIGPRHLTEALTYRQRPT